MRLVSTKKAVSSRKLSSRVLASCAALTLAGLSAAPSQAASKVTLTRYNGFAAYRLSDGATEAVVVPAINRVMRYGTVGGRNWLWNNANTDWKKDDWRNWGGDKTWLAPQWQWPLLGGRAWPPEVTTDVSPTVPVVLRGANSGTLRVTTPISRFSGARIVREYSFAPDGDFVVRQTVEKVSGGPLYISAWSVTQIVPPDAVFLPLNANSPYKNNFVWLTAPQPDFIEHQSETMLQTRSTLEKSYKIGTDAPVSSIGAIKDGILFTIRAPHPGGEYPDGALGAGLPVETWNNGDAKTFYNEMELLSPMRLMHAGASLTHTLKWRLQRIQNDSQITDQTREKVEAALNQPF